MFFMEFKILPFNINLREAYKNGNSDEQNFIQNLSLFLSTYLKEHSQLVEKNLEFREYLTDALNYLVLISEVDDTEIFKICLEYWNMLAAELYREAPFAATSPILLCLRNETPGRRQLYQSVLPKVGTPCFFSPVCSVLKS
jgi:exportin-1